MTTKILLVDDHPIFRKGLCLLLDEEEALEVIGEAGDGHTAMEMVRSKKPDLIVMDISMPKLNGMDATLQILSEFPDIKIIALSIHSEKRFVQKMLGAGAVGYILKESIPEELVNGILKVIKGDVYLSDAITGVLLSDYRRIINRPTDVQKRESFTAIEKNMLQLMADDHTFPQIIETLEIGLEAFDVILAQMMEKLQVQNKAKLFEAARAHISQEKSDDEYGSNQYNIPIIKTKLKRPLLSEDYLIRTELINQLEKHLHLPLTLISAPAGYGKSSLISAWLEKQERPYAWFSIDKKDNNFNRFLSHFLAAIHTIFPRAALETLNVCNAPESSSLEFIGQTLKYELDVIGEKYILMLDDIHLIQDPSIYELLSGLIRHPSQFMHLVLCGRWDPFLPISNLRAKNQLHEIRVRNLRFTVAETIAYLEKELHHPIEKATARQWVEKTEGWITGLRLAALSIRHRGEYDSLLPDLTGGIQYITEYLFNELLANKSSKTKKFLMASSIVDRFCAPLCDALIKDETVQEDQEMDGWQFIEILKKENLFITNLDGENYWFRFHHLFQHLLQNQLHRHCSARDIAQLHSRASKWFFKHSLNEEALTHAIAAGDTTGAVAFIEKNRLSLLNVDKWHILKNWLNQIPDPVIRQQPELMLAQAWVFAQQYDFDSIPPLLEAISALLTNHPEETALQGELYFFQGYCNFFLNNGTISLEYLEKALESVPITHHEIRANTEMIYGLAAQMQGQQEKVLLMLNELIHDAPPLNKYRFIRILVTLIYIHIISGNLTEALRVHQHLVDTIRHDTNPFIYAWGQYLKGIIHFQKNELDSAINCFKSAKKHKNIIDTRVVIDCMAGLSFAYQLKQLPEKADAEMGTLIHFINSFKTPLYHVFASCCRVRLAILQKDAAPPLGWLQNCTPPGVEVSIFWIELPTLTHCRALIFDGTENSLGAAEKKLQETLTLNQSHHNVCQQIDILVLLAVTYKKLHRNDKALESLKQSITFAIPGKFIRPFIESGSEIEDLFEKLLHEKFAVDFIKNVITVHKDDEITVKPDLFIKNKMVLRSDSEKVQEMVEPLTNREIDILELLAQRFQNKEIADKLFISPETVKKHLQNIYQKFNAKNRRAAVAKAKDLGILIQ